MLELNVKQHRLERIDKSVRIMLENFPIILGGGAVRDACFGDPIVDYDIFFIRNPSSGDINFNFQDYLNRPSNLARGNGVFDEQLGPIDNYIRSQGFYLTFACPAGELYSYSKVVAGIDAVPDRTVKIQLICKQAYYDAEDLLENFDFNATRFAISSVNTQKVVTDMRAVRDVHNKKLTVNKITYPSSSINRLYKYRNKGYYVGDAIKTIVQSIANMGPLYDELEDTLYVD